MQPGPLVRAATIGGRRYRITTPYTVELGATTMADSGDLVVHADVIAGEITVDPAPTHLGAAAATIAELEQLEAGLGRKLDLVRVFHAAGDTKLAKPLIDPKARWALDGGRNIHISFTSPWAPTAAGELDAALERYAAELAAHPDAVATWCHEPDTYGAKQKPEDFIAGHRHVHGTLRGNGCANRLAFVTQAFSWRQTGRAMTYFPGADTVDLIGADGYNWHGIHPGSDDASPGAVFDPFLSAAERLGIPACVPELNTGGPDDARADWIGDALRLFTSAGVEHACLFSVLAKDAGGRLADWRIPAGSAIHAAVAAATV